MECIPVLRAFTRRLRGHVTPPGDTPGVSLSGLAYVL